jgi:hypothetical protein
MPFSRNVHCTALLAFAITAIFIACLNDALNASERFADEMETSTEPETGTPISGLLETISHRISEDAERVVAIQGPFSEEVYSWLKQESGFTGSVADVAASLACAHYLEPLTQIAESSSENQILEKLEDANIQWVVNVATHSDVEEPPMNMIINYDIVCFPKGMQCCYIRLERPMANELMSEYRPLADEEIQYSSSQKILRFVEPNRSMRQESRPIETTPTGPYGPPVPITPNDSSDTIKEASGEIYLAAADGTLLIFSTNKELLTSALRGGNTPSLQAWDAWNRIDPNSRFWGMRRFTSNHRVDPHPRSFLASAPKTDWVSFCLTDEESQAIVIEVFNSDPQDTNAFDAWVNISPNLWQIRYRFLNEDEVSSYTPRKGEMACRKENPLDAAIPTQAVLLMFSGQEKTR